MWIAIPRLRKVIEVRKTRMKRICVVNGDGMMVGWDSWVANVVLVGVYADGLMV